MLGRNIKPSRIDVDENVRRRDSGCRYVARFRWQVKFIGVRALCARAYQLLVNFSSLVSELYFWVAPQEATKEDNSQEVS